MNEKKAPVEYEFCFQSYGVKVGIVFDESERRVEIQNRIGEVLPHEIEIIKRSEVEHFLTVKNTESGRFEIDKDGEMVAGGDAVDKELFFNFLNSQIRLTVAEYAAGKVFLHAGAVAVGGAGLIIPASSFAGKSTLVAALVKKGAVYYSDEYAVIDENGFLNAFPKTLSMRETEGDKKQTERSVESIGGAIGTEPIPIALALICKYEKGFKNRRKFAPEILSGGQGTLEILAHAIPVRYNPNFTLETLCKVTSRAIIAKCQRGDADEFASLLIDFLNGSVRK